MKLKYFLVSLLLILFNVMGFAQVKTFNNSINNQWDEPGNWTPFGLPTTYDSVYVSQQVIIPYNQHVIVRSIEISTSGELILESKQDTSTQLVVVGNSNPIGINNYGRIINSGYLLVLGHYRTIINHGTIQNKSNGLLDLELSESSFITNYDSILNNGKILFVRPLSNNLTNEDYPLHNERVFINKGYMCFDTMNYGAILNSGGQALFQNEDTLIIKGNGEVSGLFYPGIKNYNGTVINSITGYLFLSTEEFGGGMIKIEQSILENYGKIVIENTGIGYTGIDVVIDGILRNEGFIHIIDCRAGISIFETGSFYQRPSGEILVEASDYPLLTELYAILDIEGILDIH